MPPTRPTPPQGQPSEEPWHSPRYGRPPKRGKGGTIGLILAVIVLLAAVLLLLGVVPLSGPAAPNPNEPNITITNFTAVDERPTTCYEGGPVDFRLNLVNSGAPGYATVAFRVDTKVMATQQYHVARNGVLPVGMTITVTDCNAHTTSVGIVNQTAG